MDTILVQEHISIIHNVYVFMYVYILLYASMRVQNTSIYIMPIDTFSHIYLSPYKLRYTGRYTYTYIQKYLGQ